MKDAKAKRTANKAAMIARAIVRGKTGYSALKKAGFSESSARKGLTRTFRESPNLAQAVKDELDRWILASTVIPAAETRAALVRQRLIMNVLEGKDKAVQSAKLLGQDREVNLFEPEVRTGIQINVSPPAEWQDRYIQPAHKED